MRFDTVFLDAGGVLVRPNWARIATILGEHGVPAEAARLTAAELQVHRRLDDPALVGRSDDAARWHTFMRGVLAGAGVRCPDEQRDRAIGAVAAAHAVDNLWESVFDDVVASLERLRAAGLRMVVVSNANGTVGAKLERVGLARFMDTIVDSGLEGVEKPDPRIFHTALARAGARAERTVHVGDYYEIDVVGARAAGVHALLLDRGALHGDRDCDRYGTLTEIADAILA